MAKPPLNEALLPKFSEIDPATIEPKISAVLNENRQKINQLLSQNQTYSWDNLMQPLEDMSEGLNNLWSPISHMHGVMETEALRKAYNQVLPLLTEYHTEIGQNTQLYNAIKSIRESDEFNQLNPAQQKIIENDIRDFKLAGIHLPEDQKKRLGELQKELSQLTTTFSEHLLDATGAWILHINDVNELKGLPEQAIQLAIDNAKHRNLTGYVLTLDYPSYTTGVKFLENRALRKQLYEAYSTRASDQGPDAHKWDNTPVIEAILKVRHEIAQIVGFDNYATYSLATKMAKRPEEVLAFLQDLAARSKSIAEREYHAILNYAKEKDGLTELEAWDISYYSEKLRVAEFEFSQEDLRPYFPIDVALKGLFDVVNKLYGISIRKEEGVEVWHPDVKFFSLYDENQQFRGGVYMDLYARPHKRDGAWMDECRVRFASKKKVQPPVAFLTCNFMPPVGDQPALLNHDDVITLFHEFGHCLQHLLSKVDYPSVSGINGVLWDAVEFPSQFMENYCWEKASLDGIAKHFDTGKPLPDVLYQKMIAAKNFQTGLLMMRQLEFALYDFRLHLEYNPALTNQAQTILDDVRKKIAVIPVPTFNRFQHSFSHIFAGAYAAGYYSYKWAEVLSADAYSLFEENGIFDHETGISFLKNILEPGGVPDPMEAFVAFRGRTPIIDPLLRHNGIT